MSGVLHSRALLLAATLAFLCESSGAAELWSDLKEPSPDEGFAEVRVRLNPGNREEVAGLQFDLHFDEALLSFEAVKAGPAAADAYKVVNHRLLAPGTVRVIIAGLNRNVISGGETAVFRFRVTSPGVTGDTSIAIKRPILSDLYGTSVPVDAMSPPPIERQATRGGDDVSINAGNVFAAWTSRPQTVLPVLALLIGGAAYLRFRFRRVRKNTP